MCTPSLSIVTGTPPIVAAPTVTTALYAGVPSFVIDAVTWMPSITIWPPPRLTRPRLDSPLVTSAYAFDGSAVVVVVFVSVVVAPAVDTSVAGTRAVIVDDLSSDSPSPDVDADDSDRAGLDADGRAGVVVGGAGLTPPTGAWGVDTAPIGVGIVTVGAVAPTFGTVTVGFGVVTAGTGDFGASAPSHFAFHAFSAAGACRRTRRAAPSCRPAQSVRGLRRVGCRPILARGRGRVRCSLVAVRRLVRATGPAGVGVLRLLGVAGRRRLSDGTGVGRARRSLGERRVVDVRAGPSSSSCRPRPSCSWGTPSSRRSRDRSRRSPCR